MNKPLKKSIWWFFAPLLFISISVSANEHINSLGMKFVLIPAGTFTMGRTESAESLMKAFPEYEDWRFEQIDDEESAHQVEITKDFYLGQYEITVGQFRQFIKESGYIPESIKDKTGGYGYNKGYDPNKTERRDAFEGRSLKYSWENPGFPQTENDPVTNLSWGDVVFMAEWLSKKEGKRYRLPTEAEWEYSCLGGTQTRFGVGDDPDQLSNYANLYDQETAKGWGKWKHLAQKTSDGFPFTAPVGSFQPNAYNLYDMNGNVWEWVSDYYSEKYSPEKATDPKGPTEKNLQIRRGGSWHTWAFYSRCQFRNWNTAVTRYPLLGGRLMMEK